MNRSSKRVWFLLRWVGAVLIGLAAMRYLGLIVFEGLAEERRLTLVELGILLLAGGSIALLVQPNLLGLVKLIEVAGIKLELERLQEKQKAQESELETMRVMLPLLLPEDERSHLKNLANGRTAGYYGNADLRQTLRRLRSTHLLQMKNGHHVSELQDGRMFDLADYIELTSDGWQWLERIKAVEKEQQEDAEGNSKRSQ
ncbi:hypothetical protein C7293_17165 [filamentous cyanobacterium CCT1]|nr:hypothetical protein C7293_17165 [filamentous cyanobacterium CCT1]PSN78391.1 hypothetical protein C8B47_17140 [filamentous cyanobacterium CCP4]